MLSVGSWVCVLLTLTATLAEDKLNMCMDGMHHKVAPSKEGSLYNQCEPWKDNACCTANISEAAHNDNSYLYNFNWNHCGVMSERCKKHFIQDTCFYECSPHLGPWIEPTDQTWRKERIVGVPLCREDCETWWEDCKDDLTCKNDWHYGWDWKTGVNHCPAGAFCRRWTDVWPTAQAMCEQVWSGSYRATQLSQDSGRCMRLWFKGPNPNRAVAEYYLNTASPTIHASWPLLALGALVATLNAPWLRF